MFTSLGDTPLTLGPSFLRCIVEDSLAASEDFDSSSLLSRPWHRPSQPKKDSAFYQLSRDTGLAVALLLLYFWIPIFQRRCSFPHLDKVLLLFIK